VGVTIDDVPLVTATIASGVGGDVLYRRYPFERTEVAETVDSGTVVRVIGRVAYLDGEGAPLDLNVQGRGAENWCLFVTMKGSRRGWTWCEDLGLEGEGDLTDITELAPPLPEDLYRREGE
jgi:hypothetical protein